MNTKVQSLIRKNCRYAAPHSICSVHYIIRLYVCSKRKQTSSHATTMASKLIYTVDDVIWMNLGSVMCLFMIAG